MKVKKAPSEWRGPAGGVARKLVTLGCCMVMMAALVWSELLAVSNTTAIKQESGDQARPVTPHRLFWIPSTFHEMSEACRIVHIKHGRIRNNK